MNSVHRRAMILATMAGAGMAVTAAHAQQSSASAHGSSPAAGKLPQPGQRQGEYLDREDGTKIFYQRSGHGSPMLLVHGYPLSGALFGRVRDKLSQTHEVITLDLRGYGQSHAAGVTDSVDVYAEDAIAVLDKLGVKKAIVGGMSMGGPTILSMYRKAPDRFAGMVLIDTTAKDAPPPEKQQWQGFETLVRQKGVEAMLPLLLPVMLTGETRMNDHAQSQYLTEIVKRCSTDAALSGAKALANRPDSTDLLSKIDVPALILVGLADGLYPVETAQSMQQQIKGAKLHIVPKAAHAAIFESPDNAGAALGDWAGRVQIGSR